MPFHPVGQQLQAGNQLFSFYAGHGTLLAVHSVKVEVGKRLAVAKRLLPQGFCLLALVGRAWQRLHTGIAFQYLLRMIRQFGLPQSLYAHVLFTIQVEILLGHMLGEKLVDHRVGTLVACVGFLHTYVHRVVRHRTAISERHQLSRNPQRAAHQWHRVPVCQAATYGRQFRLGAVGLFGKQRHMALGPLLSKGNTLVCKVAVNRFILIVGIE